MSSGQRQVPSFCTERDISRSPTFKDVWKRYEEWLQPSIGAPAGFANMEFAPDGKSIIGVATVCTELKSRPATQLMMIDTESGQMSTFGDRNGSDSHPQWSPDGKTISFLSQINHCSQLHLLDLDSGSVKVATSLRGNIEQQSWSHDGQSILLTVAGLGADVAGIAGGRALVADHDSETDASWMPIIETTPTADAYRTLLLYNISSDSCKQVSPDNLNIWQAVWTSNSSAIGICSDKPGEEAWYHSSLREISLETDSVKEVFTTDVSMEWLSASPDGERVAYSVGVASDRQVLAGDLYVLEVASGRAMQIDTHGVNVNATAWADTKHLIAAGLRDSKTVIIMYDWQKEELLEIWSSEEYKVGGAIVSEISASSKDGKLQCAFLRSGWFSPPTLCVASPSDLRDIKIFTSSALHEKVKNLGCGKTLKWKAPDGLEIHGYLLTPSSPGPHPTLMHIHGGPVSGWRPQYLGEEVFLQVLLEAGFAIFKPNPRGSWGQGQSFARQVYGDMGGLDTHDYSSGIDYLVDSSEADPNRLGVFGSSYGGYMSAWLISQTNLFKAAVPISPVTDWVSEHLSSNLGRLCQDFLGDDIHNLTGKYFSRSPIHHVKNVKTPSLIVCGALDKNTPMGQGIEFHHALVEQGTPSALVIYPQEGHSIRGMPESIDLCARSLEWFRTYLL